MAKVSKKGQLTLLQKGKEFKTISYAKEPAIEDGWDVALNTVWTAGNGLATLTNDQSIDTIRSRSEQYL